MRPSVVLLAGVALVAIVAIGLQERERWTSPTAPVAAPAPATLPAPAPPPPRAERPRTKAAPAPEREPVDELEQSAWASVDMKKVRAALPENIYWTMSSPTDDPQVLEARAAERERWNVEYGKVLSNTATAGEIEAYYAHRKRLSSDYIAFAAHLLSNYGRVLPKRDLGLLRSLDLEVEPDDLDRDVAIWERHSDAGTGILLLVESREGRVVGTAAVQRIGPAVAEVKRMWLRPECRRLGLGRRLLDACFDEARALGCRVVRLDSVRRFAAALALYRAYGFRDIPDYNGNPRAEVWMERAL